MTIIEIEQIPEAREWINAVGGEPIRMTKDGQEYLYRVFTSRDADDGRRLAVVMNLAKEELLLLEGSELRAFLSSTLGN